MKINGIILASFTFIGCIMTVECCQEILNFIEERVIGFFANDCTCIKNIFGLSYENVEKQAVLKLNHVYLNLYTSNGTEQHMLLNAAQTLHDSPNFNIFLRTVIIIHGYLVNSDWPRPIQLAKNLKILGNLNVLTLDHRVMSGGIYFLASTNTRYLGEALGNMLSNLYTLGVRDFHLIGHSLGAHISGFAGKIYKNKTGTLIQRITGLDAAGPCFFNEISEKRLTKTDAMFVDAIHTDAYSAGIVIPIGHVDFYPNSGRHMPKCIICSHGRSSDYYAESIIDNKNGFLAVQCLSWNDFQKNLCTNNPRVSMGYWVSNTVSEGQYYLKTAASSPYALFKEGIM